MSNLPEQDPSSGIQMTPVEFSPPSSPDSVGTVVAAPRQPYQFPIFVPILIILLVLNIATVRDIIALNKRMSDIHKENAPALELLQRSTKQADFVNALRDGILKLAPTDPIAAQVAREFFPPPPTPPAPTTPAKADGKDAAEKSAK